MVLARIKIVTLAVVVALLLAACGGDNATLEDAQSITTMLAQEGVPIQSVTPEGSTFVVTYAAEDAVGRFDDALIHDWGMIFGTVAAHDCEYVSIITTLDGEPYHKQTVACEAVRAFVRGVFTEAEFQVLVEHENLQ